MTFFRIRVHPLQAYTLVTRRDRVGFGPPCAVAAFSMALILQTFLSTGIPPAVAKFGRVGTIGAILGIAAGFGIPFLLWLYFALAVFLILSFGRTPATLPRVAAIVGVNFIFPFLGKSLNIVMIPLAVPEWANVSVYVFFTLWGAAGIIAGLKLGLSVPVQNGVVAVAVTTALLEIAFYAGAWL